MMANPQYVPCILKNDAIERGIVEDIIVFLSNYFVIEKIGEFTLTHDDVISYKMDEWINKNMGNQDGIFRDYILDYEASRVFLLKIYIPKEITYNDLIAIKGESFLPCMCSTNSVRGHFRDESQLDRLVKIKNMTLELLPNGKIVFPRNIIHIPDNEQSSSKLRNIIAKLKSYTNDLKH